MDVTTIKGGVFLFPKELQENANDKVKIYEQMVKRYASWYTISKIVLSTERLDITPQTEIIHVVEVID
jgi:hypothetical protein